MRSFRVQYQEGTNNTKRIQSSLRTLSSALHGGTARKGNKLWVSPLRLWQSWPWSPSRRGRVEPGGRRSEHARTGVARIGGEVLSALPTLPHTSAARLSTNALKMCKQKDCGVSKPLHLQK